MGLMDKVKAQAEQAMAKAQQGVTQGQAKLEAYQAKQGTGALLRDLGAAYYAQQRTGGSPDAVTAALAALDSHAAEHGPIDTAPSAAGSPGAPAGSDVPPAPEAPGGGFNLDDV
jgi:hypothetical protein